MFLVKIAGLGYYLPERRVDNQEIAQRLGISPDYIERAAGVRERRYATTTETSVNMAVAASRMALAAARMDLGDLDVIVGASSAPQQAIPCTAALTQRELGAPEGRSACFDINATCLSFAIALHAIGALIASGAYAIAPSSSAARRPPARSIRTNRESYVLFGDAAAAAIVTRSDEGETSAIHHARFETHSSGADATRILGGGTLHLPDDPTTTPEMNQFSMNGRAVFRQAGQLISPFLDRFFEETGWTRESVRTVIPHQASGHAVNLLTSRLGFTDEQVFLNLRDRGNCVAASIPLALAEAVEAGRIERGDHVLLAGTGAGIDARRPGDDILADMPEMRASRRKTRYGAVRLSSPDLSGALASELEAFRVSHPLRRAEIVGRTWTYIASGSGAETVLILPGVHGLAEAAFHYITALERHYRVITPNYPAEILTLADLADGLAALLDLESIEQAHVYGGSFGALVAQAFVRRHGERVLSVILEHSLFPRRRNGALILPLMVMARTLPAQILHML